MHPTRERGTAGFLLLFVLIAMIIWALFSLELRLRPALSQAAELKSRQLAIRILHETIQAHLQQQPAAGEWLLWRYDRNGRISAMQLNPAMASAVSAQLHELSKQALQRLRTIRTSIPLGQALNSPLLTAIGPRVPVVLEPSGTAQIRVMTRVKPAGINMVMVEVYARIDTEVLIMLPLRSNREQVTSEIPLSVSMIAGDVPQWHSNAPVSPSGATTDTD